MTLLFFGMFFNNVLAQNMRNVSGIVKDSRREAVIGATVVVKDLQIGTTTDLDGKFSGDTSRGKAVTDFIHWNEADDAASYG